MASAKRSIWAWAFYDWANSAFATTVLAGFFPIFFRRYWNAAEQATSTSRLGYTHSLVALVVAIVAPILGALADRSGRKKQLLLVFAAWGSLATVAFAFVGKDAWLPALVLLALSTIGFACGNSFYDALIVDVCPPAKRDWVSGLGYGLGYLGGGILFALNMLMVVKPQLFGLADEAAAIKAAFISVGVWWIVFTIPLALWVREKPSASESVSISEVFSTLAQSLKRIINEPVLRLFLLAYFCYIDGVNTIIKMAVDFCQAIEIALTPKDMMLALLLVQIVAFPAALVFSKLGERIGARFGILICVGIYALLTLGSVAMQTKAQFYGMAIAIGLIQGAVQALSRSLFSRLIPADRAAEYFGIYNILGKFAAILGPLLVGLSAHVLGPRYGLISLLPLFIGGGIGLLFVRENRSSREA